MGDNGTYINPDWSSEEQTAEEMIFTEEEAEGITSYGPGLQLENDILATNFTITSLFNIERTITVKGKTTTAMHYGLDITSKEEKIFSCSNGILIVDTYSEGYGNWCAVYDPIENLIHFYGHMKTRCLYDVGNEVYLGQMLGFIGNTGYSTGAHLHYGIIKNKWDDPKKMTHYGLAIKDYEDPVKYLDLPNAAQGAKYSIKKIALLDSQRRYAMTIQVSRVK